MSTFKFKNSFTLTGLPPSVEDVEEFNRDHSDVAYSKFVDKYLSTKTYAEKWGRHWLDVARYAEDQAHTFGVKPNSAALESINKPPRTFFPSAWHS